MDTVLFLLLTFPLMGALTLALTGRGLSRRSVEILACTSVLSSWVLALTAFLMYDGKAFSVTLCHWFSAGTFQVNLDLYYDAMSAVMALMVTFVAGIVHIYSVAYMRHEEGYVRYFCFLNLFVFAMLVITMAGNLVFLYLGWEAVGLCSYALIGFWFPRIIAANAGRKAFIVTRLGDVAFGIAIALCWAHFGQLSVSGINDGVSGLTAGTAAILGMLFLWAAAGKSAQLPLSVWLPDAMAGPTPVSALIHAATMVTAGVYLLMRFFPVIQVSPFVMAAIASVGVITIGYGALAALAQTDIKRILAFSTISQVGYMFLAVGAGDLAGSMFHLISHAFFKSLLFLTAGCMIQTLHEEQNIFRMGKLRQTHPQFFWLFLAGTVSLAAVPLSGGFFSKDSILMAVYLQPHIYFKFLWLLAMLAAMLTPLYAFRLFFVVFFAESPEDRRRTTVTLPRWMTWGLWPLAVLSIFSGLFNLPINWHGGEWLTHFLAGVPDAGAQIHASSRMEWILQSCSGGTTMLMILIAWLLYGSRQPEAQPSETAFFHNLTQLCQNGFHLDQLYQTCITAPFWKMAGFLWINVDENRLDAGLDHGALSVLNISEKLRQWTTGELSQYLTMMMAGFALMLCGLTVVWWYL